MIKKLFAANLVNVFTIIYCLLALSCSVGDDRSPAALDGSNNDSVIEYNDKTRTVEFVASGDDGFSGIATVFDLRYFTELDIEKLASTSIDDLSSSEIEKIMQDNFGNAIQIQGEVDPEAGGILQSVVFTRVEPFGNLRYFLSLNIRDEVGNNSGPSNVVEASTSLLKTIFEDTSMESCFGASVSSGNLYEENDDDEGLKEADDIIIGDPCKDTVYIFRGNKSLGARDADSDGIFELPEPDSADIVVKGIPGTMFGAGVAALGDIRRGELDEIVISAPAANSNTGQVIVIFDENNDTFPSVIDINNGYVPDLVIDGDQPGDKFGQEIITARGIIGSANDNIIVGAPPALSGRGRVYLFKENILADNSSLTASDASAIFSGESQGDQFGSVIVLAGIIDDDSRSDLAVSSPGAAKVYVIFGDNDIDSIDLSTDLNEVATISGNLVDEFGVSVAGNGDIDGDPEEFTRDRNRDDLVIGAPGFNLETGKVFIYSGFDIEDAFKDGINVQPSHEISGVAPGGRFGQALTYLGDFNPEVDVKDRSEGNVLFLDDPTSEDIAVSATGIGNGRIYLFFGDMDLPFNLTANNSDITLDGTDPNTGFGSLLENLNDINSDELNDFAIGEAKKLNVIF